MVSDKHNNHPQASEARYDLSDRELQSLAERFLHEAQDKGESLGTSNGAVIYEIDVNSEYANIGRCLERIIFGATFENNNSEVLSREYGPYEDQSSFFVLFDEKKRKPVGVLRYIKNGPNGLKTLNDISVEPLCLSTEDVLTRHKVQDLDKCWDVGTLGVLTEYRGKFIKKHWNAIMLYRALYKSAVSNGVEHMFTVMDERAYSGMKILGIPFETILDSEGFPYIGSDVSYALHGEVGAFFTAMDKRLSDLKDRHFFKSYLLRRAMTRLMLGKTIDKAISINDPVKT